MDRDTQIAILIIFGVFAVAFTLGYAIKKTERWYYAPIIKECNDIGGTYTRYGCQTPKKSP